MGILIDSFQTEMKELTESELAVFTMIDNQPEIILSANLTELAHLLHASNSTIIRCCQKLGFSGFSEFRAKVKSLVLPTGFTNTTALIDRYALFFDEILPNISVDKLNHFAEQIHNSHNIFILGLGLTKPIAEYMSKHLYQLDRESTYVYENHMLDLLPNLVRRGDLVLFISESGETASLINCVTKVAQTGATLLSITNAKHNTLNYSMSMTVTTGMSENYYHNYDVTSRVFQMAVIDLILDIYLTRYLKNKEK